MKTRPEAFIRLAGLFIFVFVHLTEGSAIREKSEAKPNGKVLIKKHGVPVQKNAEEKLNTNSKLKISKLKPCISKAFCEVNSIVNTPTYDANKEFYTILNRLNKFTEDEQSDFNGSSSVENDDEPSSEESSYEYSPRPPGPPGRYYSGPRYPGYRHGKAVDETESDKLKRKNKKKLKKVAISKKSINGTDILENTSTTSANKTARIYTEEEIQQKEFLARKTRELKVAEDLAALIKISSEIGQAIRSPRRCRELFKKCEMSYDQIITIFNHTQTTEKPEKEIPTTKSPKITTTTTTTTTTVAPVPINTESSAASSENNRSKKSRHDFSDEDIEYVTDTELHQPVRTYALFSPHEHHDSRHPEEIIVEEAFKKFDNTFPISSSIPKNIDFLKKSSQQKSKNIVIRQRPMSSEEEEDGSNESSSGSRERPGFRIDPQYSSYRHRNSDEGDDAQPSAEVVETENKTQDDKEVSENVEETELTGTNVDSGDFEEDNADEAESPSDKPERKKKKPSGPPEESSEEEEEEDESSNEDEEQKTVHTRDEEPQESENSENVRPNNEDQEKPLKVKASKGNKKGNSKKRPKPEKDENSSEEEQEMPPPGSEFYGLLQDMNDGEGADGLPDELPKKGKRPSSKGRPGGKGGKPYGYGGKPEGHGGYGGKPEGYGGSSGYGGKPESYGGPGGYGGQSNYQGGPESTQPSFVQSIMSWFSGGNKQGSSEQQQQPYSDQPSNGGYGQKPYGGKQPSTYDDYKKGRPSNYPPQSYSSRPSSDEGYPSGPPPSYKRRPGRGRRPPQGRDYESSEEAENEEAEDEQPQRGKPQQNKRPQGSKNSRPQQRNKPGPPPPVVVIPEHDESYAPNEEYGTVVKSGSDQQKSQDKKSKPKQKPKEEPEASEEESRETSSEEVKQKSKNDNKKAQAGGKNGSQKSEGTFPSYENYYTSIFGGVKEPTETANKNNKRKPQKGSDEDSLLLSEFDKISNSFSTSADKIPDWSEEDNPKQKINVGSLASNGPQTKGKYTVKKNRNKTKHGGQNNHKVTSDKEAPASSEEEEEDKKK